MFARYYVELPIDATFVERALLHEPETWLPGLAGKASSRGERLLAEVGFGEDVRVGKEVEIRFGREIRVPTKTIIPLSWRAVGVAGLFPELDADLEVAPLGSHQTQLSMSARYVPPLGVVGRVIDRAVLHRVAEATMKDFLDQVADALQIQAREGRSPAASG
ncbi:MAG: hypothetical protein HY240_00345 [Actinobacteria bacterium]|nr:hypothetical protein [Actinomycetota bacterium]